MQLSHYVGEQRKRLNRNVEQIKMALQYGDDDDLRCWILDLEDMDADLREVRIELEHDDLRKRFDVIRRQIWLANR